MSQPIVPQDNQSSNDANSFLVVLDFPGIKKYVFESNKLTDIVGASALLSWINQEALERTLDDVVRTAGGRYSTIYLSGGGGQILLSDVTQTTIDTLVDSLTATVTKHTAGAVKPIIAVVPWQRSYANTTRAAYQKLKRIKRTLLSAEPLREPLERDCDACSHRTAIVQGPGSHDQRLLCEVCQIRAKYGTEAESRQHLFAEFATEAERIHGTQPQRPSDFTRIAGRDRLAIVYADGNAMGALIQNIKDQNAMAAFSIITDSAIKKACHRALIECGVIEQRRELTARCQILMLGGDDMIVALPGRHAFDFVLKVSQLFSQMTHQALTSDPMCADILRNLPAGKGLSLSFGVTFANPRTPVSQLLDRCEELLKRAKVKSQPHRNQCWVPESLDWHDFVSGGSQELEQIRKPRHTGDIQTLSTMKAWLMSDFQKLYHVAEQLRGLLTADYSGGGLSRGRLFNLGESLKLGYHGAMVQTRKLAKNYRNEGKIIHSFLQSHNANGEHFPWAPSTPNSFTSPLSDLVEVCQLISNTG